MRIASARSQGNLWLVQTDGQPFRENLLGEPAIKEPVDRATGKPGHTFLSNMEAIACGVEAWFEENIGYSQKITETTIEIARGLNVPESEIRQWASARSSHDTEKGKVVQSLLVRLQDGCLRTDNGGYPAK